MELSILIPHYGDSEDTLALVSALKEQECSFIAEIIVSDDCSPQPFPQLKGVRVVHRQVNGGFGANVNSAAAAARGEWLLILNSDLTLSEGFLEKMMVAARQEGGAMIAPQILGHDGQSQWVGRKFPTIFQQAWEWFTPVARFRHTSFWHRLVGHDLSCTSGRRAEPDWLMGACMMLRRQDYQALGGMDETFFMNSEEVDLQYRLAQAGIKRVFRGDILISHEGGASSGGAERRRQWLVSSRFKYERKWGRPQALKAALTLTSYLNFVFNSLRSIRNRDVKPGQVLAIELGLISRAEKDLSAESQ